MSGLCACCLLRKCVCVCVVDAWVLCALSGPRCSMCDFVVYANSVKTVGLAFIHLCIHACIHAVGQVPNCNLVELEHVNSANHIPVIAQDPLMEEYVLNCSRSLN